MVGKNKNKQTMSLQDFLKPEGETPGSWADEEPAADVDATSRGGLQTNSSSGYGDSQTYRPYSGRGDSFSRGGDSFSRGGDSFSSRGDSYSSRGDSYSSRGDSYSSRGDSYKRAPADFPTEPPFKAYMRNLNYDTDEEGIRNFFRELKIVNVDFRQDRLTGKPMGAAFIIFEDLDSLKAAVELSGESLDGRNVNVEVALVRPQQDDRTSASSWRREKPLPSQNSVRDDFRSDAKSWRSSKPSAANYGGNAGRETLWGRGRGGASREEEQSERPRLKLQPRTVATESSNAPELSPTKKNDPFGGATAVPVNPKNTTTD